MDQVIDLEVSCFILYLESMAIFTQKRGVPDNWNYIQILKIFQILKFIKLIEAYLVG